MIGSVPYILLLLAMQGISLFLMLGSVSAQEVLPHGWRKPSNTEASGWRRRKRAAKFLTLSGDFDGDAVRDLARLLVNPSQKRLGLFVRRASTGVWQLLKTDDVQNLERLGLDLVKPGRYETACR